MKNPKQKRFKRHKDFLSFWLKNLQKQKSSSGEQGIQKTIDRLRRY